MTLSELVKSIFRKAISEDMAERKARIKGDDDRTEYKHIVHVLLSDPGLGEYNNNNLYFIVRNYDGTLISNFTELLSNYEPYENITIYNEELENTNMCVVKSSENSIAYNSDETELPIDIDDSNVVVIEDHCVSMI